MKPNWINFKELRAQLSFVRVLEFYKVDDLKEKGGQLVGFCPIPNHNGNRRTPSFSAHPEKGIFQCFGCGAKGNILDFAVLMENGNPTRGLDVRKAALKLNKLLKSHIPDSSPQKPPPSQPPPQVPIVNEPLNFRLKDLDSSHDYLMRRGFRREIIDMFGVGYCSKGVFAGRIAIPLHDSEANLIGYAGRAIDDSSVAAENPKYLFPGKRERDGEVLEFRKSLFLYNGYRFRTPVQDLVVVEGFPAVWWLTQHGYRECVALMGASSSPSQTDLLQRLTEPKGRLWILADGDSAGHRCADELCAALRERRFCRVIVKEDKQPTDYSGQELNELLGR